MRDLRIRDKEKKKWKNSVYFAHPYAKRHSKGEKEIIQELKNQGYHVIDPFEGEEAFLASKGHEDPEHYYKNPTKPVASELWDKDFYYVEKCGVILVWMPVKSTGTPMEFSWAMACVKFANMKKRIIVIDYSKHPGNAWGELKLDVELYSSIENFKNKKKYEW